MQFSASCLRRAVAVWGGVLPFQEDFRTSNTNLQLDFLPNQKSIILLSDDRTIHKVNPSHTGAWSCTGNFLTQKQGGFHLCFPQLFPLNCQVNPQCSKSFTWHHELTHFYPQQKFPSSYQVWGDLEFISTQSSLTESNLCYCHCFSLPNHCYSNANLLESTFNNF